MKLTIDTDARTLDVESAGTSRTLDLYSPEAFEEISRQWVRVGWNEKYTYTFTWFGRPVIQLPEDMVRLQEVLYTLKPDVIIETGVAHGGSLIFYASLCKAMERGRVIGIDIEIRPHNRKAIEEHELFPYITLVEGSSIDPAVVKQVTDLVKPGESVLILLDSNHTRAHVLAELQAYSPLVSKGSYIVATDGVMRDVADVPRAGTNWETDNPTEAVKDFLAVNDQFIRDEPKWRFNESPLSANITHWPGAWLRRRAI